MELYTSIKNLQEEGKEEKEGKVWRRFIPWRGDFYYVANEPKSDHDRLVGDLAIVRQIAIVDDIEPYLSEAFSDLEFWTIGNELFLWSDNAPYLPGAKRDFKVWQMLAWRKYKPYLPGNVIVIPPRTLNDLMSEAFSRPTSDD